MEERGIEKSRTVVVVHGILDTWWTTRPMRRNLERAGFRCVIPKLRPASASTGIEDLAGKLRSAIEADVAEDEEFAIVAFSMGGIVSRYYLQELGGNARCRGLYTVSSPHNGTIMGHFFPTKGAKQMVPKSDFLDDLNGDTTAYESMDEVVSYRTPLDSVIVPSSSSKWRRADNVVVWSMAHPLMMFNRQVHRDLVERLDGLYS